MFHQISWSFMLLHCLIITCIFQNLHSVSNLLAVKWCYKPTNHQGPVAPKHDYLSVNYLIIFNRRSDLYWVAQMTLIIVVVTDIHCLKKITLTNAAVQVMDLRGSFWVLWQSSVICSVEQFREWDIYYDLSYDYLVWLCTYSVVR